MPSMSVEIILNTTIKTYATQNAVLSGSYLPYVPVFFFRYISRVFWLVSGFDAQLKLKLFKAFLHFILR